MASKRKFESEALQYTYDRFIAGDPEQENSYEEALFDTEVASLIYDLHQGQVEPAVAGQESPHYRFGNLCLEDADCEGHSLAMLRRIAAALGKRVEIRFVPERQPKRARSPKVA